MKHVNLIQIYCDLDGVIVDFEQYFHKIMGETADTAFGRDGDDKVWAAVKKADPNYFTNPKPIAGYMQLIKALRKYKKSDDIQVAFLSAYPKDYPEFVGQKNRWVRQYVGADIPVICVPGATAKLAYVDPYAILIDDWKKTISSWNSMGSIGIAHSKTEFLPTLQELDSSVKKLRARGNQ